MLTQHVLYIIVIILWKRERERSLRTVRTTSCCSFDSSADENTNLRTLAPFPALAYIDSDGKNRNTDMGFAILPLFLFFIASFIPLQEAEGIRVTDLSSSSSITTTTYSPSSWKDSETAIFALGSFWQAEAVFGCIRGVLRTTAGYTGGSKPNPEYRNIGDHAEAVQVSFSLLSILSFYSFYLEICHIIPRNCCYISTFSLSFCLFFCFWSF